LYRFEPTPRDKWKPPILPKDDVLAKILKNHADLIVNYHEHDSLLENKQEEELTEEQRKAAWEEYENPPPPPPPVNLAPLAGNLGAMDSAIRAQMYRYVYFTFYIDRRSILVKKGYPQKRIHAINGRY